MKRKIAPFSLCFYFLSVVIMLCGILSVVACHQNISAQLSQGIPIKGNELTIMNLYLQSGAQYLAYATLLYAAGRLYQLFAPPKFVDTAPPQPHEVPESMNGEQYYQSYGGRADEEEEVFQSWGSESDSNNVL